MARAALILIAFLFVPAATAKTPPPDSTFQRTISGVKYLCAEWGAPPKQFVVACVPKAHAKKGLAA